ncbi:uncharacterized protein LOC129895442 [Solanum dulcamara]|uniref:uncharacterized protein LOC129895442 n=1 Tax=Solanum dulcamara TaxID=45834 RepID=UPI002486870C|nr:uncharacterized protein LOC129895442 [Solanum dulcamara]
MKCFTACFRTNSNHNKIITKKPCSNNKINSISPQVLQDLLETRENGEAFEEAINDKNEEARHKIVNPINLFEESKDKEEEEEEKLNQSNRKNLLETSENDEGLLANQVSANCSDQSYPSNLQKQNGEEEEEVNEVSNSSVSSYISYRKNHRYHCCFNSNDRFDDIDLEDEANNNDDGNEMIHEESSYESLFSLSIDNSTRKGNNPIPEIMCDKEEVNSPLKPMLLGRFKNADRLVLDPSEIVHFSRVCNNNFEESEQHRMKLSIKFSANDPISQLSVLNPIRSPRLLKDIGFTTPSSILKQQEEKENVDTNLVDFCITNNRAKKEPSLKSQENEIAVDASLSSWLVERSQDDTPNSKNNAGSVGNSPSEGRVRLVDRPILGALTIEEIKDEKLIVIGTIGSYLRHTGQATGISSY